jgi:hypothetical protein
LPPAARCYTGLFSRKRETCPPGPVKHLQKLLFIAAKGKKHVFCLHPGPDHVKYNLEKETK